MTNHSNTRVGGTGRHGAAGRAAIVLAVALSLASLLTGSSWGSTAANPGGDSTFTSVIVRAQPGAQSRLESSINALGGTVGLRLGIVNGVSARVPRSSLERLRRLPVVLSVTPNSRLKAHASTYDPTADPYSMRATTLFTGARAWWNAGYTGRGVDVALIDSGIAPVEGLTAPGKVINGPDLSLQSQVPNLTYLDTFGHGTFMAGLIAARDDDYRGMAPGARIVSVKVAATDGGTDVSQVIAAIDWVVQHANDDGLNIRVLNLSYGTRTQQPYKLDPLAFAAEQAWKRGIVVVAAAGNTGQDNRAGSPALTNPAYDPHVIAAGASLPVGSTASNKDRVADFSAGYTGCGVCRGPDFVAPGSHLQGLRVPNSWLDLNHPEGQLGERYFRGSGTSQAAAITSGAVALLLDRYPGMTPDLVKRFLQSGAVSLSGFATGAQGAGELRLTTLLDARPDRSWPAQRFAPSTGTGLLELSRGDDHLTMDGVVLRGERDIFGKPVDTAALAALEATASSWSGGEWNGSSWSGSSWSGSSWSGSSWSGSSWSGSSWSGSSWSGSSWSGSSWSGESWNAASWS